MALKLVERTYNYNVALLLVIGVSAFFYVFIKFFRTVGRRCKKTGKDINQKKRGFCLFFPVSPCNGGEDPFFKKLLNIFMQKIKKILIMVIAVMLLFVVCYCFLGTDVFSFYSNFGVWNDLEGFEFLKNFKNKFCLQADSDLNKIDRLAEKTRFIITVHDAESVRRANHYKIQIRRFLLMLEDVSDKSVFDYWFNIYVTLENIPTWLHKAEYLEEVLNKPLPENCRAPEYKIFIEMLEQARIRCLGAEKVAISFMEEMKKLSNSTI